MLVETQEFLVVNSITKRFAQRGDAERKVVAVDNVSFSIPKGEIAGLVGESGSGKTTLGKILVNLTQPDSGEVLLEGKKILDSRKGFKRESRRGFSMIFQDPYEALNPAKRTFDTIAFPARVNGVKKEELRRMVYDAMRDVKLTPPEEFAYKYPHQLSGGQRQRVAIARSIILRPQFLVLDEPTSMLDASLKVGIMNLLSEILKRYRMTAILITHDLAVAARMCSRLLVMYRGSIVEEGSSSDVISNPSHPYTMSLISAIPQLGTELKPISLEAGDTTNLGEKYCKFYPRCPWRFERCRVEEPANYVLGKNHSAKCFLYTS
ncbi:MAG TPA: ABC transporter ATP-binding protein [Nitrososphaerales archaeon]|nr:ABC transporter ATP-binding protein [Nitrososphaerales archaeon]